MQGGYGTCIFPRGYREDKNMYLACSRGYRKDKKYVYL
jgi:hypothetical protein